MIEAWTSKNFPGVARAGAVSFMIGTKGYVVGGYNGTTGLQDCWEFDTTTESWVQKTDFPSLIIHGIGFSVGTKGYVGFGASSLTSAWDEGGVTYIAQANFYEFDPVANTWTNKPVTTITNRWKAVAFTLNNVGYVGFGDSPSSTTLNDFYVYDAVNNVWSAKAIPALAYGRRGAGSFVIGSIGYLSCGSYSSGGGGRTFIQDLYSYDPSTNIWTVRIAPPFSGGREDCIGFAIGTEGYMIGGHGNATYYGDGYGYYQDLGMWLYETNIPSGSGSVKARGISFSTITKVFMGTGGSYLSNYQNDFYQWNYYLTAPSLPSISRISATQLEYSWNDNSFDEDYFVIERRRTDENGFTVIGTTTSLSQKAILPDVNTKLLLYADGVNNSTTFTDASGTGKVVSSVIGVPRLSTNESKFGSSSIFFNGSSYIAYNDSPDWDFSTSDFTIDFWMFPASYAVPQALGNAQLIGVKNSAVDSASQWLIRLLSTGAIEVQLAGTNTMSSAIGIIGLFQPSVPGTWYHIAVTKSGITTYLYINGIYRVSGNFSFVNNTTELRIGGTASGTELFTGFLDDIRIIKGTALWSGTGSFTPPSPSVIRTTFTDNGVQLDQFSYWYRVKAVKG